MMREGDLSLPSGETESLEETQNPSGTARVALLGCGSVTEHLPGM